MYNVYIILSLSLSPLLNTFLFRFFVSEIAVNFTSYTLYLYTSVVFSHSREISNGKTPDSIVNCNTDWVRSFTLQWWHLNHWKRWTAIMKFHLNQIKIAVQCSMGEKRISHWQTENPLLFQHPRNQHEFDWTLTIHTDWIAWKICVRFRSLFIHILFYLLLCHLLQFLMSFCCCNEWMKMMIEQENHTIFNTSKMIRS